MRRVSAEILFYEHYPIWRVSFIISAGSQLLLGELFAQELPELFRVLHAAVGENQRPVGGGVEVNSGIGLVGVEQGLPFVTSRFLLVGGGDAAGIFRQDHGVDLLGANHALLPNLPLDGGKEGGKIHTGDSKSDGQQHITQQHGTGLGGDTQADKGTGTQNRRKNYRAAPLLPALQNVKHRKLAELPPAQLHINRHKPDLLTLLNYYTTPFWETQHDNVLSEIKKCDKLKDISLKWWIC